MTGPTIECTRILADLGNTVIPAVALLLAIAVVLIRWKDVFRSDLRKRQLEELATVRRELHDVWVGLYYLPFTRQIMETRCLNIDNLREEAPEQWDDLMRYSECSRSLFYKFQFSSYFLFPSWLDRKRVDALKSTMSKFAPFTLMSSTTPDDDTRRAHMDAIVAFIDYLDQQLQRRY